MREGPNITTRLSLTSFNDEALMSRLSMTVRQSPLLILSDTTCRVANSSSSADTLLINSTPFLQSALCKDGVLIYYSYSKQILQSDKEERQFRTSPNNSRNTSQVKDTISQRLICSVILTNSHHIVRRMTSIRITFI